MPEQLPALYFPRREVLYFGREKHGTYGEIEASKQGKNIAAKRHKKFRLESVGEISGKCSHCARTEGQVYACLNLWQADTVKSPRQQTAVGPADRQ